MTARLGVLVVDAADPALVAGFWRAAFGSAADELLRFRREQRPKVVKNRVHLDVYVREVEALLDLGAGVIAEYLPTRVTLADVEGNEFCAFIDPDLEHEPPARAFAVCTDSDRPEELAAWWAGLVGADVGPGPDGTPRWLYGSAGWERLIWKFVRVSDEPLGRRAEGTDERVVPNRWQWTLKAGTDAVLAAGASRSPTGSLTDPQGNEFSVEFSEPDPSRSAEPETACTADEGR